jgi:integrase
MLMGKGKNAETKTPRGIVARGDKVYMIFDQPRDLNGKRKQKWELCPPGTTPRAAALIRAERLIAIRDNQYTIGGECRFGDYLRDWHETTQQRYSPPTRERYRQLIESHIIPALGRDRMDRLRPIRLEKFLSTAAKSGRLRGSGGLAPKTVKHLYTILNVSLKDAVVKWKLISYNPMDSVDAPPTPRREIEIASDEDITKLLFAINNHIYRIPMLISLSTGLRRGEVCGLQWGDLDTGNLAVRVSRSIYDTGYDVGEKGTKNKRNRSVAIPAELVQILLAERDRQAAELKRRIKSDDYICINKDGVRIRPHNYSSSFYDLRIDLGIRTPLHGLRHTYITHLFDEGIDPKTISEQAGHSSVAVTLDIYTHVAPHHRQHAGEVAGKLLRPQTSHIKLVGDEC